MADRTRGTPSPRLPPPGCSEPARMCSRSQPAWRPILPTPQSQRRHPSVGALRTSDGSGGGETAASTQHKRRATASCASAEDSSARKSPQKALQQLSQEAHSALHCSVVAEACSHQSDVSALALRVASLCCCRGRPAANSSRVPCLAPDPGRCPTQGCATIARMTLVGQWAPRIRLCEVFRGGGIIHAHTHTIPASGPTLPCLLRLGSTACPMRARGVDARSVSRFEGCHWSPRFGSRIVASRCSNACFNRLSGESCLRSDNMPNPSPPKIQAKLLAPPRHPLHVITPRFLLVVVCPHRRGVQ